MAKREKKTVHKVQMTEGKRNIIHQLIQEYDIQVGDNESAKYWLSVLNERKRFIVSA